MRTNDFVLFSLSKVKGIWFTDIPSLLGASGIDDILGLSLT
jgi:hypothetical protein